MHGNSHKGMYGLSRSVHLYTSCTVPSCLRVTSCDFVWGHVLGQVTFYFILRLACIARTDRTDRLHSSAAFCTAEVIDPEGQLHFPDARLSADDILFGNIFWFERLMTSEVSSSHAAVKEIADETSDERPSA